MTKQHEEVRVSAQQLLSLLIASLDTDVEYTPDAGRWTQMLFDLREEYGDDHPELFRNVSISMRGGRRPYSSDVSEFLTKMQMGSVVAVMNPDYVRLKIRKTAQEEIIAHYSKKSGFEPIIELAREMAGTIAKSRALRAPKS